MNNQNLEQLINSSYFKELYDFYLNESILDVVGISRKENIHTNFLYWLLSEDGSCGLGLTPAKYFISSVFLNPKGINVFNNIITKDWLNPCIFACNQYKITDYKLFKEYYIDGVGRVDLMFTCKLIADKNYNLQDLDLLFVIENKINCSENNSQTIKYQKYFDTAVEFKDKNKIYIYLAPDITKNKPESTKFFSYQYDDLVTPTIYNCLNLPISNETKIILNDYLRCLTFTKDEECPIISVTAKEKNIVLSLWKYYFNSLHYIIMQEDDESKTTYELYKSIFDNIFYISIKYIIKNIKKEELEKMKSLLKKDIKIYEYNGNKYKKHGGKYSLSRLALDVIRDYVTKKNPNISTILNELDKVCATYHTIPLIIEKENLENLDYDEKFSYFLKQDDVLRIDGKEYFLYSSWSTEEILRLINTINADVKIITETLNII